MQKPILEVKNLTTKFYGVKNTTTAVDNISFDLYPNEILGIIGESGSGKSVTSHSILRLIEQPGEIQKNSKILFHGENILEMDKKQLSEIRGNKIAMIFQEPSSSFNPLFSVGSQIGECLRLHKNQDKKTAFQNAISLLEQVHIPNPTEKAASYPFQMSGGMLQRSMTALALSCNPEILIADEPTTALDVTTQAQVLGLIKEKQQHTGMSVIFITHDLALVEDFCDRIIILYAGRIMEIGEAKKIIQSPEHPYTQDLLKSILRPGMYKSKDRLFTIPGKVPESKDCLPGCKYAPRCSKCTEKCTKAEPDLINNVRCYNA